MKRKLDITALDHLCPSLLIRQCREDLSRQDYEGALLALNKRDRLDGFEALVPYLTDRQYWRLLADVWTGTEFPTLRLDKWLKLFRSRRRGHMFLMDTTERRFFAKLPELVRVYRACDEEGICGISWTLDMEVAKFFVGYHAVRTINSHLWTAVIKKRHIFAFLDDRQEKEVVLDSNRLKDLLKMEEPEMAAA